MVPAPAGCAVPPTDAAGTPRPPPVWCTPPGTAAPRPQKRSGSKRIPPLPILCSGSAKGERAAEKPAGFPAGSSSCNNYKKRFANVRTRCPLPRPLRVRPQEAPSLFFREAARQIVTELSSPLRFFSTSSKGGIFTKAVYQKVFDFWRKIITKA